MSTATRCPGCGHIVPARRVVRQGDVYLAWRCPRCGPRESLLFRDAALLDRLEAAVSGSARCHGDFACAEGRPCPRHLSKTANLMLHVTDRCDLHCTVCLAAAGDLRASEPSAAEIAAALPYPRPGPRPNVCLIGGEPTVRRDLPELVRTVIARGYVPRLNTNGRRLHRDPALVAALWAAGLRWVILQFDGVDDAVYRQLRGRPLLQEKRALTEALRRRGFKVQYAVMVARGVNDDLLGAILDEAQRQGVFWVSLYPASAVNRNGLDEETHLADALHALDRGTAGRVTAEDFLRGMRLFDRVYRLTGRELFRQKALTLPTLLVGGPGAQLPFTRLLDPRTLARHPGHALRIARHLPAILGFERRTVPEGLLFLTVKKFQGAEALDLVEASDCHMSWVVPGGLVAYDVFNACWRGRDLWGDPAITQRTDRKLG